MAQQSAASPDFAGVARSAAMRTLLTEAARLAQAPRPILIRGERGVGKELLARYLHDASPRAAGAFVVINCAAVQDTLAPSELFGHEKGAFTGAVDTRAGQFELAHGGTLFLDEVGIMPRALQEAILRVLEYPRFRRLRGRRELHADVRIVSATNADLETLMADGLFRRDLYDRLTFAELTVPPLRKRLEDLPHLVIHLVERLHAELPNLPRRTFREDAIGAMLDYYWPGNVRELKNAVERAYLYGAGTLITPADLPPAVAGAAPPPLPDDATDATARNAPPARSWRARLSVDGGAKRPAGGNASSNAAAIPPDHGGAGGGVDFFAVREALERRLLEEALANCRYRQRAAAEYLRLTYDQFRRLARRHGLLPGKKREKSGR